MLDSTVKLSCWLLLFFLGVDLYAGEKKPRVVTPISAFEPKRQNVTSQDIISQNNTSVDGRNPAITR